MENKIVKQIKNSNLNDKLDLILKNQKKILKNEEKIIGEELKLEEMEAQDLKNDVDNLRTEEDALKELEKLDKKISKSALSPLKKVTKRDLFKGFVGAFFGLMGHFAFYKGADIAYSEGFSVLRATMLYLVAFIIIVLMLYYTGFRKVKKNLFMSFMPIRAFTIYMVSIFTILLVNLMFNKVHMPMHFWDVYKLIGSSIILAVIGAGTADLIGGGE